MKDNFKTIITLCLVCAVVVALLAVGNYITAPIIEKNKETTANSALIKIMPSGEDFKAVDISDYKLPDSVEKVYSEKNGGYVFQMSVTGYSSGLVILCGIDKDGILTGSDVIASGETLGYENTYGESLLGVTAETLDSVDTVSGATKTTTAYKNAARDAFNAFVIINGGTVDLRSEEDILNDNLSAALTSADGKFTEMFITASVPDITSAYAADNGSGYVVVSGEQFIAFDNNLNILTSVSDDVAAKIQPQIKLLADCALEEIDINAYNDMPSQIQKAYKTSTGSYVFELRAAGYGINGDKYSNPSGEYIYIRASVTAEGEIISAKTVSQKETDGVGSACAEKGFYSQFSGKTEDNYNQIDAISGATITTKGYLTAISKIFTALKLIKGEV